MPRTVTTHPRGGGRRGDCHSEPTEQSTTPSAVSNLDRNTVVPPPSTMTAPARRPTFIQGLAPGAAFSVDGRPPEVNGGEPRTHISVGRSPTFATHSLSADRTRFVRLTRFSTPNLL